MSAREALHTETTAPNCKVLWSPSPPPFLSKGYVFQTGVWVPLIVSGPLVVQPNRKVMMMKRAPL